MDIDDDFLIAIAFLLHVAKKKKKRRRFWVHPLNILRLHDSQFYVKRAKLRANPDKFFKYYRMSINSFDELFNRIREKIQKNDTHMRLAMNAEEKLAITLRFLATGKNFQELFFYFNLGSSTISALVRETCEAIWDILQPLEMKPPASRERWMEIAGNFYNRVKFPNCVGACDGKHVRLISPLHSGSTFFNYKKYSSIVLMAIVDADYCFTAIDVGSYGRESDSNIFKNWTFAKKLTEGRLNLPEDQPLPGTNNPTMPYVFVGDEAFPIGNHFLRPYPKSQLNRKKRIFNYRLSSARRLVECTFGILSNKWRIFHTSMTVSPEFATLITKTACVLHNFVRRRDGYNFDDTLQHYFDNVPFNTAAPRSNNIGRYIRDTFAEYFVSPAGEVPFQYHERIIGN